MNGTKDAKFKLIVGFLAVLALVVCIYARLTPIFPGDLYITVRLQSFNSDLLLSTMQYISFIFGGWSSALLVVVIGIIVWWRIGRLEAIMIPVAGLIALLDGAFKLAIGRPRPSAVLVHVSAPEQGYGFPSGHAFFVILVLGLTAYFLSLNVKRRSLRILALASLAVLILLVGTSRVYLGVHWPSDVLGGYLIGGVFLTALIWFHQTRRAGQTERREQV